MAQKKKRESFFWISYSDLMTSLFFIMLVLFVLSTVGMYMSERAAREKEQATQKQLEKIKEIQEAVQQLPIQYFEEDSLNRRWSLKRSFTPQFDDRDDNIYLRNDTSKLLEVGRSLIGVINRLNELKATSNMDISYLVVIEGMASRDNYPDNDGLSYRRALSLYKLWKKNGISFEDSQCEVQIAGSGIRGIRPFNTDYYEALKRNDPNADSKFNSTEEKKNQCIIIQIVPKISNID